LVKGESRAAYDGVLRGLRKYFKPEGTHEELLVERLAKIWWCQRRLDIAETAEIRKATEIFEEVKKRRQEDEAVNLEHFNTPPCGLIQKISNPRVLEACIKMLKKLRSIIEEKGLFEEYDKSVLAKIYGVFGAATSRTSLFHAYQELFGKDKHIEGANEEETAEISEVCKLTFCIQLSEEIGRLTRYKVKLVRSESKRIGVELLCGLVPNTPDSDKLLRYGSNRDRVFERTLNQLERAQRTRKGMPVPPMLN
jgi:hypothetical protein